MINRAHFSGLLVGPILEYIEAEYQVMSNYSGKLSVYARVSWCSLRPIACERIGRSDTPIPNV